jgi:hypothetical protein
VLASGEELRVVDFERMRLRRGRVPEEDRLYLLGKLNRLRGPSRTDRWRFLKGYADADAPDRRGRNELARRILGWCAHQNAIDADRVLRRCTAENRDFGRFEFESVRGHYLKDRPGRPQAGLTAEGLRALVDGKFADGLYDEVYSEQPLEAWKRANCDAGRTGRVPVAVLIRKDLGEGRVVYRLSGNKAPAPGVESSS